MRSPLVGPAYTARSKNLSNQQLINLYVESMEGPNGAEPNALLGCPGLVLQRALPTNPLRAMRTIGNVIYAVAGNTAYALDPTNGLSPTTLGTLPTALGPAYIEYNATQVGFFDSVGLNVWGITSMIFQSVPLPFAGPVGVPATLDTLTVVSQPGTYVIWQCDPNDLTTWDPLNFTTEDGNAEPIVALIAVHDQIIVFKQNSSTFYVNEGNNGFVFGRLEGVYPARGCIAPASAFVLDDQCYFLGQSDTGGPRAYIMRGYEAVEISTYALENEWTTYAEIEDTFAYGYEQGGHPFALFVFPSAGMTWAFDLGEFNKLKTPPWHRRAGFFGGQFTQYAGTCAAQFQGIVYLGDTASGNVYRLDLTNYQDNGQTRKWLRSWRATQGASKFETEKCNYLDIEMDTGEGVAPGANPQLVLRQSFDGGLNWSAERYTPAGKMGNTTADVRFRRLGTTKRGLNSDRTFELSSTDPFFTALLGAEIG